MSTYNKIDYSKFKCEVFTSDGVLLKEALMNLQHEFYCENLEPGSLYFLAFSYDGILLECFAYRCPQAGKVLYINPAYVIFSNQVTEMPLRMLETLRSKIEKRIEYAVPFASWSKQTLQNHFTDNPNFKCKNYDCSKVYAFGIGADISARVS